MLTAYVNRLTGEIEQIAQRLDHTEKNVSGTEHYPFVLVFRHEPCSVILNNIV